MIRKHHLKCNLKALKVSKMYAVKSLRNRLLPGNTSVCELLYYSSVVDLHWCLLIHSNKDLLCHCGWKDLDSSCLLVACTLCVIHGERQASSKSSSIYLRSNDVLKNCFFHYLLKKYWATVYQLCFRSVNVINLESILVWPRTMYSKKPGDISSDEYEQDKNNQTIPTRVG